MGWDDEYKQINEEELSKRYAQSKATYEALKESITKAANLLKKAQPDSIDNERARNFIFDVIRRHKENPAAKSLYEAVMAGDSDEDKISRLIAQLAFDCVYVNKNLACLLANMARQEADPNPNQWIEEECGIPLEILLGDSENVLSSLYAALGHRAELSQMIESGYYPSITEDLPSQLAEIDLFWIIHDVINKGATFPFVLDGSGKKISTLLHWAAENRLESVVERILKGGEDPDLFFNGRTALSLNLQVNTFNSTALSLVIAGAKLDPKWIEADDENGKRFLSLMKWGAKSGLNLTEKNVHSLRYKALCEYCSLLTFNENPNPLNKLMLEMLSKADERARSAGGDINHSAYNGMLNILKFVKNSSLFHDHLILVGKALGYPFELQGLCYGFSNMFRDATLQGGEGLNTFLDRLMAIMLISPEEIGKKVDAAREEAAILRYFNEDARASALENKSGAVNRGLRDGLSKETQILLEVPAFFEGMQLYYSPQNYVELFEPKNIPQAQEELRVRPLLASHGLEALGGGGIAGCFVGVYNQKQMRETLEAIRRHVNSLAGLPRDHNLVFDLDGNGHAISLGLTYNDKKKEFEWIFADVNRFPFLLTTDDEQVASEVFEALSASGELCLGMTLSCLNQDLENLSVLIDDFRQSDLGQEVQNLNGKKDVMYKMLSAACKIKDNETIEKIFEIYKPDLREIVSDKNARAAFIDAFFYPESLSLFLDYFAKNKMIFDVSFVDNVTFLENYHSFELLINPTNGIHLGRPSELGWGSCLVTQAAKLGYRDIVVDLIKKKFLPVLSEKNEKFPNAMDKSQIEGILIDLVRVGECPKKFDHAWALANGYNEMAKTLEHLKFTNRAGVSTSSFFAHDPIKSANDRRFTSEVKIEEKPTANDRSFKS